MAFATVQHWQDPIVGLREMQRVARRLVVFTCDTSYRSWRRRFWLTRDYLPEVAASRVGLATELARAIGARMEPCSFRGIALTASSRPTGDAQDGEPATAAETVKPKTPPKPA